MHEVRKRLAVVCVLALALAIVSACQKSAEPPSPSAAAAAPADPGPQMRWIVLSPGAPGNNCASANDPHKHVNVGDTLIWVSRMPKDQVTVHFGNGSPFRANNFQLDAGAFAGAVVESSAIGRTFGYDLSPKVCPGPETGPDVIVDGGSAGPPKK
jgi:hypothetical protein